MKGLLGNVFAGFCYMRDMGLYLGYWREKLSCVGAVYPPYIPSIPVVWVFINKVMGLSEI